MKYIQPHKYSKKSAVVIYSTVYKKLSHIFQQWTDLPLILSSSPAPFFSKQKLNAESIGKETELDKRQNCCDNVTMHVFSPNYCCLMNYGCIRFGYTPLRYRSLNIFRFFFCPWSVNICFALLLCRFREA